MTDERAGEHIAEEGRGSDGLGEVDAALVHAGLERINAKQREALTLRFLGGLSYEEIVDVVGRPLGTVPGSSTSKSCSSSVATVRAESNERAYCST